MASMSVSPSLAPTISPSIPLSGFVTRLPLAVNIRITEFYGILDVASCARVSRSWRHLSNQEEVWRHFAKKLNPRGRDLNKAAIIKLIIHHKQRILEASRHRRPREPGGFCPLVLRNGFESHLMLSRIGLSCLAEAEKIALQFSPEKDKDPDLYVALGQGYLQANQPQKAVEVVKRISGSGAFGPGPLYYSLVSYYLSREQITEAFQLIMEIPRPVIDDEFSQMYLQSIVALWFGKCEEQPTHSPLLLQIIRQLMKPGDFHFGYYIEGLIRKASDYGLTVEVISKAFPDYRDYRTATRAPS